MTPLAQWPDPADVDDAKVTGVEPRRRDIVTAARFNADPAPPAGAGSAMDDDDDDDDEKEAPASYVPLSRRRRRRRRNHAHGKHKTKRSHRHGGAHKRKRHDKGEEALSVSMAQWRDDSGNRRRQVQREWWLKLDRAGPRDKTISLFELLRGMPSAKVSTVAEMQTHTSYLLRILGRVLPHNVDRQRVRRVRRSRFQEYI